MAARHADLVAALRAAVFDGAGVVDPAIRRAAGAGATVPETWAAYVGKVRDASYRIADDDVTALKAAGCTERRSSRSPSQRPRAPRCSVSTSACGR